MIIQGEIEKIMKKKYLLIGILMAVTLQAYTQKTDETVRTSSEYEIVRDYDPNAKTPQNETTTLTKPILTPAVVSLASFDVKYFEKEKLVRLTWIMSKKLGTFIVESMTNGDAFQEIGRVDNPIGFEQSQYTFDAKKFESGLNFYRLKQEINGDVIYSQVKWVSVEENSDVLVFELTDKGDAKRVELRSREIQNVIIQLYDAEGNLKKELFNQNMTVNEIIFRDIKKDDFPKGDYFVVVKGQNFKKSKKITLP